MFEVKLTDGSEHSLGQPPFADLVKFERHFSAAEGRKVSADELNEKPTAEYLGFLIWLQLKRASAAPDDFEAFLETIDTIRMVDSDPKDGTPAPLTASPLPVSSSS